MKALCSVTVMLLLCVAASAEIQISAVSDSAGNPAVTVGYDLSDMLVKAKANEQQANALKRQAVEAARMAEWQQLEMKPWLPRVLGKAWFHVRNVSQDHPVTVSAAAVAAALVVADQQGWLDFDSNDSSSDSGNDQDGTGNTQIDVEGDGNTVNVGNDND